MTSTQVSFIFFVVGLIAVLPVLYYYYKRNPNPRFRPPVGEMAMISLFALLFVGGGAYLMGTVLTSNPEFDDNSPGKRTSRPKIDEPEQDSGGKSRSDKKKSPFPF